MSQLRYITVSSDLYDGEVCYVRFLNNLGQTLELGQRTISFQFTIPVNQYGTLFVYLPRYDNTFVINIPDEPCPEGYLLQEDYFTLDQEDNSKILIT